MLIYNNSIYPINGILSKCLIKLWLLIHQQVYAKVTIVCLFKWNDVIGQLIQIVVNFNIQNNQVH